MSDPGHVNPHYLGHVVDVAEKHDIEVCEDIVSGNGIKLLAKGARINAEVRDRLLQHKLRKPLEDCVRVAGGLTPDRLAEAGAELTERHLLLRELVGPDARAVAALKRLHFSPTVQSLLTVYCEHRPDKLLHAVGGAMLAYSLIRRVAPGDTDRHVQMLLAGLLHDVGELYIDPRFLEKGRRLQPDEWKHIVTHPIIAYRLLKGMDGVGPFIAEAVLQHHERLDGFGYPHGLSSGKVGIGGQVLSVAELLTGLIESAQQPLVSATVAMKLIPGEFSRDTLDAVVTASQAVSKASESPDAAGAPDPLLAQVQRLAASLQRFQSARGTIEDAITRGSPALKALLRHGVDRMQRIQLAFSSTGLDAENPARAFAERHLPGTGGVQAEAAAVVRELEWRMKELERESLMRVQLTAPNEAPVIRRLIDVLKGKAG